MNRSLVRTAVAACATILLAACQTQVRDTGAAAPPAGIVPPPGRVLVYGFSADPSLVRLNQGILARRQRAGTGTSAAERQAIAFQVQDAIAETLVEDIRKMGLPAERAGAGASPGVVPRAGDLIVAGRITAIDEGNRARRVVVGFGAGGSEVKADVAISVPRAQGGPAVLKTFEAEANSGRLPGMGASIGMSAASGAAAQAALGTASTIRGERRRSPVAQEGERLAQRVAVNLGAFFAQQGWIAPDRAPSRFSR